MLKKAVLLFFLLITFFSNTYAQWEWLNPMPSGFTCQKIHFMDTLNGFILNSNGDLIATNDQGNTWKLKKNFPKGLSFSMKDSTAAITGDQGVFYVSKDNGNTWAQKSTGFTYNYFAVDVVSRDTIFLASPEGKILRTDNGGDTWFAGDCFIQISSFDFINSRVGFVGGASTYILKTDSYGISWDPSLITNTTPSKTTAIHFKDLNNGFAYRNTGDLWRTTNGGTTWTSDHTPPEFTSFQFINDTVGFAGGPNGIVYRTNNGGITWTAIGPYSEYGNMDLRSIFFINSNLGFAVGYRGRILKTIDGGSNWQFYSPTYLDITDFSAPTKTTAYATAGKNIYKTSDSGRVWQQLALSLGSGNSVFEKCHFFNADTGIVFASEPARMYKTKDGGLSWTQVSPSQYGYQHITDLQFVTTNTGYAELTSSFQGKIIKTEDGGQTWTDEPSSEYFDKIYFRTSSTAFASRGSSFYRTLNGGASWTLMWQSGNLITGISFVNNQIGFVVGENNLMQKTTDGGATWSQAGVQGVPGGTDFYSIGFLDDQVGYLTTKFGNINKTTDGGLTWKTTGNTGLTKINNIHFGPNKSVFVTGQYGSILRSDVRELKLQSFNTTNGLCSTTLTVSAISIEGTVDSVRFEYGINDFNQVAIASPSTFFGPMPNISATLNNLIPATSYKVRLKYYFSNNPYILSLANFQSPALPYINVLSGNVLASSVNSGNQWFLNGSLIPGATGVTYAATASGNYTVQVSNANCSITSAPFSFFVTAIPTLTTDQHINIVPNPADDKLVVNYTGDPGSFTLLVTDMYGRQIFQKHFDKSSVINIRPLPAGTYLVEVINEFTKQKFTKRFLKN